MTTFTQEHMELFAGEAWGNLGRDAVRRWSEFNERFFGGRLRPVPLVISRTLPFGAKIGQCSYSTASRSITLNIPRNHNFLVADNGTLLHEMVHQCLFERGENPHHAGKPWCREIMRLTKLITGRDIWAGRTMTKRVEGDDFKLSKVVRINERGADGQVSLCQKQIARWPHDGMGIDLGRLGAAA